MNRTIKLLSLHICSVSNSIQKLQLDTSARKLGGIRDYNGVANYRATPTAHELRRIMLGKGKLVKVSSEEEQPGKN